jgi:hypothetical protein
VGRLEILEWELALLPSTLVVSPIHGYFGWTTIIVELERDCCVSNMISPAKIQPQGNTNVLPTKGTPNGISQETLRNKYFYDPMDK